MLLVAVFLLLLVATAFQALLGRRVPKENRRRALLLFGLRLAAAILLAAAYLQPTLRFSRLVPKEGAVGILIDASQSMELFGGDSAWAQLSRSLEEAVGEAGGIGLRTVVFGDSTRALRPDSTPAFNDGRSFFPAAGGLFNRADVGEVILLTDGNWSNASPPSLSRTVNYHYVTLSQNRSYPFVAVEPTETPRPVPQDSASQAVVRIEGHSSAADNLLLALRHHESEVCRRSLPVDTGDFSITTSLPLPTDKVGTRLYSVEVTLRESGVRSSCNLLLRVEPKAITVAIAPAAPSLDKRFLAQAIHRHPRLRLAADPSAVDIVIVTEWSERSRTAVASLPMQTTAAFVGALPCSSESVQPSGNLRPTLERTYAHSLSSSLPAPAALVTCTRAAPRLLRSIMKADPGSAATPLLYEAVHERRRVLILAVRGLWRWDFLPLGADAEAEDRRFTDFLLDRLLELHETNTNNSFYAYPANTPLHETDSLKVMLVLPASLRDDNEVPVSLTLTQAPGGDTVRHETIAVAQHGSGTTPVMLPPFAPGDYRLICGVATPTGELRFDDRFEIHASDAEFRVRGQNGSLLGQLASPIDLDEPAALRAIVERAAADPGGAAADRIFNLRRTAPLLMLLLAVLSVEWLLRRVWRMD